LFSIFHFNIFEQPDDHRLNSSIHAGAATVSHLRPNDTAFRRPRHLIVLVL